MRKQFNVPADDETLKALAVLAAAQERSKAAVVRHLVKEAFKKLNEQKKGKK